MATPSREMLEAGYALPPDVIQQNMMRQQFPTYEPLVPATPSREVLEQTAGLGGGMYALPPDVIQQNMMRQQLGMPAMSSPPMDPTLQYQLQLQAERQRMLDQQAAADAAQAAQQPPTGPMSPYQQLTGQGATAGAAPGQAVVRDLEGRGSALDYYLRLFGLRGGAQNSR